MSDVPEKYQHNHANLPQADRDAMQRDKSLWLEAHRLFRNKPRTTIQAHLKAIKDHDQREDMRRRLNTIRSNSHAARD